MKHFTVFLAITRRNLLTMWRYPFDFVSGLISLFLIFLFVFYGAKSLGNDDSPAFGNTLSGIILGFMLWTFTVSAYSELTFGLIDEAQHGTLEQLYMSPVGFGWVCTCDILANLLINFAISWAMLLLMMTVTGRWLHIDLISAVPVMLLIVWGVYGVGFIMGGLALVFKRVGSTFHILHFVCLGLIAVPLGSFPYLKYAPIAWGSNILSQVMIEGCSIFSLPRRHLVFLAINSAVYFALGLFAFGRFQRLARSRGLLGHY